MDSGCSHCVLPPSALPEVPIRESTWSKAGRNYEVANGTTTPNLGQKMLSTVRGDGQVKQMPWQVADITEPLSSVAEVTDDNNLVIFGSRGGFIWSLGDGWSYYAIQSRWQSI